MSVPAYDTRWGGAAPRRVPRTGTPSRTRRPQRPRLRLVPPRPVSPPRTPFAVLVLALLAGGLVALLLLNAAGVANADRQRTLRRDTAALQVREQQLSREVSAMEAPARLADAARRLGMVPGGQPAFLVLLPDGSARVVGTPAPVTAPPTPAPGQPTTAAPGPAAGARQQGGDPRGAVSGQDGGRR